MSADVRAYADQLRQYAEHFSPRDWNYTRNTGDLVAIRYATDRTLLTRVSLALREVFRRHDTNLDEILPVPRFGMAKHYLRRDPNLPDGVLDGGNIITHWEETGEYLQYVQPSVGSMLADWMQAEPDNPHAQRIADEMRRINDAYGARIAAGGPA